MALAVAQFAEQRIEFSTSYGSFETLWNMMMGNIPTCFYLSMLQSCICAAECCSVFMMITCIHRVGPTCL